MSVEQLTTTDSVLNEVKNERVYQENRWGEQNHNMLVWYAILGEEVGEVAEAILTMMNVDDDVIRADHTERTRDELRSELIQVAAVAVAAVESLDRQSRDERT